MTRLPPGSRTVKVLMLDAPGGVILLVVLWPQRFQAELVGVERGRWLETDWHELVRGHDRERARTPARRLMSLVLSAAPRTS